TAITPSGFKNGALYRRSLSVSQCVLSTLNVVVHSCVLYHKENLPFQRISDFKMIVGGGSHVVKGEVTAK
ncbi:MAG: hypothetical protein VX090_11180, partial [Pseudomonadota bacterium]|nr:hypothetical protein [Pseudomonadota bacterium]